jgi:hypothetical protein
MAPDNDTISRALLKNLTPREIDALLNTRTARQRRDIMSQLTPRQRVHLKQWRREHPATTNPDQSLTGLLLLGVVILAVIIFVALILFNLPHVIK